MKKLIIAAAAAFSAITITPASAQPKPAEPAKKAKPDPALVACMKANIANNKKNHADFAKAQKEKKISQTEHAVLSKSANDRIKLQKDNRADRHITLAECQAETAAIAKETAQIARFSAPRGQGGLPKK